GRITSKLTLSYFTSDINAEIKEISTSEEFNPINQDPMQMIYNPDLREKNYIVINNSSTKPPCCLSDLRFYKNDVLLKPKYVSVNEAGSFVEAIFSTDESLDAKPAEFFESIPQDYEIGENECKITLESLYGVYNKDYGLHKALWQGLSYENGLYYYCVDRNNNFDAIKIKCEQGINLNELNKISFVNNIGNTYKGSYLTTDIKAQKLGDDGNIIASASLNALTHNPQAYELDLKGVEQ
ncbi:hypothetical protein, partial [Campylobacter sp. US33a]|uniref:hypothetical protein n=1 Tax=Campylobacter sp. US33a TaxID=2498120 RepID=UPI00141A5869